MIEKAISNQINKVIDTLDESRFNLVRIGNDVSISGTLMMDVLDCIIKDIDILINSEPTKADMLEALLTIQVDARIVVNGSNKSETLEELTK